MGSHWTTDHPGDVSIKNSKIVLPKGYVAFKIRSFLGLENDAKTDLPCSVMPCDSPGTEVIEMSGNGLEIVWLALCKTHFDAWNPANVISEPDAGNRNTRSSPDM